MCSSDNENVPTSPTKIHGQISLSQSLASMKIFNSTTITLSLYAQIIATGKKRIIGK